MAGETRSPKYLNATDAAARLGIHRATLYAYVSRGYVRAESDPRHPHASRYLTADVEHLRDRKEARLRPGDAARKVLHFGLPVLPSAVTLIEDGRVFYRGEDVLDLARTSTFERVIALLWGQAAPARGRRPRGVLPRSLRAVLRPFAPADRLQFILPVAARADRHRSDVTPAGLAASGWRIVYSLVAAATLHEPTRGSIADHLAIAWHRRDPETRDLVDKALILCADHELNVSAFAVRVAASARSSPYDAILAGLCALRGSRHGGQTDQVEQLFDEAGRPERLRATLRRRLRRGEPVPGFGHPLYPDGDPRGRLLRQLVVEAFPSSQAARWVDAVDRAGADLGLDFPTLDCGLVLLRRALRLPSGAAFLLFALGRSAGWMAHAIEQYAAPGLIRPRAVYAGRQPATRERARPSLAPST